MARGKVPRGGKGAVGGAAGQGGVGGAGEGSSGGGEAAAERKVPKWLKR